MVNPSQAQRVVSETLRPDSNGLSATTKVDFAGPSVNAGDPALVCVLHVPKGELYTDLAVEDRHGNPATVLSRTDSMTIIWSLVRHLVSQAYSQQDAEPAAIDDLVSLLSDFEHYYAANIVLPRGQASAILRPEGDTVDNRQRLMLDALLDRLTDKYPIVVLPQRVFGRQGWAGLPI